MRKWMALRPNRMQEVEDVGCRAATMRCTVMPQPYPSVSGSFAAAMERDAAEQEENSPHRVGGGRSPSPSGYGKGTIGTLSAPWHHAHNGLVVDAWPGRRVGCAESPGGSREVRTGTGAYMRTANVYWQVIHR
jgi:hypothetical protein